ncbi:Ig-like domain-containing protein [Humidisolicoccus flavus]|uniref:Ig-like domain-containing protein n=1 Tax=Humidisolicoccus flavus TaxID=3111414 RepID=UPI003249031C
MGDPLGVLRWVKSHRKATASAAIVTVVSVALGVLAFTYEGFTSTDVDLNDGGVWVTRTSDLQLGHLNSQVKELDGGLFSPSSNFDVLQNGEQVLLHDLENSALLAVNTQTIELGAAATLPGGAAVSMGGETLSVLSPEGLLWVLPVDQLASFRSDDEDFEPTLELGEGGSAVVDVEGNVHAVSLEEGAEFLIETERGVAEEEPQRTERAQLSEFTTTAMTSVGDVAAVLDAEAGLLLVDGQLLEVAKDAVLQQPSRGADAVVLATGDDLITQPLSGGEATTATYGSGGAPTPPVQMGGCIYAAWASAQTFVKQCADASPQIELVETISADSPLQFRVNRNIVVLNDTVGGNVWLVNDQMILVDNWEDLKPPTNDAETEETDESLEDVIENQPPPPTEENHPPVAVDDDFGARTGSTTVMPVLHNDSDQDGDVLTVKLLGEVPDGVRVVPITNDSQFQVELDDTVTSSFSFRYEVNDGRNGTDDARVLVSVRGASENSPPKQLRGATLQVEQAATIEYSVLPDWVDPDGDDLILTGVVSESGDDVQFRPNGVITYTATGAAGLTQLAVTVSDGQAETTENINIDVRERGTGKPVANTDFVTTTVGSEVTISPLGNDFSPNGEPLRLAAMNPSSEVTAVPDFNTGTVRITGDRVGSYYLQYTMTDGPSSAFGRIRVDVRESDEGSRPVAVRDVVIVPKNGEALVDLLQNDVDPGGGVLVVQSVEVGGVPITVELLDRRVLRVVSNRGLEQPANLTYTVSNGKYAATGEIVIIPVDPPAQPRPPVAVPDTATVREGDHVTIKLTENDFSPDNTPFTVVEDLVSTSLESDEEGVAFIDGDTLRVHVLEGGPSRVLVTYEIEDEYGQRDSATVEVNVVRRDTDEDTNNPPVPRTVTSRAIAGTEVQIPIPLDGIDPDGDGVELVGYVSGPEQGRITSVDSKSFTFQAFDNATGTTTFTYRVKDRFGAIADAAVIVGIAPPATLNQSPFAETDRVTVKPGRSIAVPVLDNDSDPDGDSISVVVDGLEPDDALADAKVDEESSLVRFTSPSEPGQYSILYTIVDSRGATAQGTIVVEVSEDAPPQRPVGVDDEVDLEEAQEGQPINVPVLKNDRDPDGDPADLEVSVVTGNARALPSGEVAVTPTAEFQIITYRITDIDGLSAEAFIYVPAVAEQLPQWIGGEGLTIPSGQELVIPIAENVTVSSGKRPIITQDDNVSATNADGSPLVRDENTLVFTSQKSYVGQASITFEVTDGKDVADPEGNRNFITIPITVTPSSEVAPSFTGAQITVAQGDDPTAFDLKSATRDPDPGDLETMKYRITGGNLAGVDVSIDGSGQRFVAKADPDAIPGATATFTIAITDRAGNEVQGSVQVNVVISNRPLASLTADTGEGTQGIEQTYDVLANDVNPFAREQIPLTVENATVIGGDGVASTTGSDVSVTPGPDFSGVLTVQYTVSDATKTTQRQVSSTLTIVVIGRPNAPVRPNVTSEGDSEVGLSWSPPSDNGASIEAYLVKWNGGQQECPATTCMITGLVNNTIYSFTVTAINSVGESDPSPASNEARPDVRPDQPAPPTAVRGDKEVALTWSEPANNGSPIIDYVVEISPPAPNGQTQQRVSALTLNWTGLTNGTEYKFRVQAANSAREPSDFSGYSNGAIPAGVPFPVETVKVERAGGAMDQFTVSWVAPNNNGAEISGYTIHVLRDGAEVSTLPAGATATSQNFPIETNSSDYTFRVTATNAVGNSEVGGVSGAIRSFGAASAPTIGTDAAPGNQSMSYSFSPSTNLNGARTEEVSYQYQVTGGAWTPVNGNMISGLANGTSYTVVVRAVTVIDGITVTSEPSAPSNPVIPFGPPNSPNNVTATGGNQQVSFSWAAPAENGRPISVWISIDGGAFENVGGGGSRNVNADFSESHRIQVKTIDSEGQESAVVERSATSNPRPTPTIRLSQGGNVIAPNGQNGTNYVITYTDMPPNTTINYRCYHDNTNAGPPMFRDGQWNTGDGGNSSTPANTYTFCMSGYSGNAWMEMDVNGTTISTEPRVRWN